MSPGFYVAGESFADAAEFESFAVDAPLGAEFFEVGRGETKRGADLGLEAGVEPVLVAGAVQIVEKFSDLAGELFRAAEVEPVLASLVAVGYLVVWAESFASIGSPGGGDGALSGKDFEVGLDELSDALEAGGVLFVLANGIAFFRVWGSG